MLSTHTKFVLVNRWKIWGFVAGLSLLKMGALAAQNPAFGLGIFGNVIGIHEGDTLAVSGNLVVLEGVCMAGGGTLSLRSEWPQHLVAHQSELTNLMIDNPAVVVLKGELRVSGELIIERAAVDARTAQLSLGDSSLLCLRAGGRLLVPAVVLKDHIPTERSGDGLPLWPTQVSEVDRYRKVAQPQPPLSTDRFISQPQPAPSPPPERV